MRLTQVISPFLRPDKNAAAGFALIEMVVALAIMALVGLMAWRGMDAMIRGRETIDRRANQDAGYSQLVKQFERDCLESLRPDELATFLAGNSAAGSSDGSRNSAANSASLASLAAGAKNIWWLRRYHADNQDAWMIVGYAMSPTGLQRLTSRPLLRRNDARSLWLGISRDPDLSSSELLVSLELTNIVKQSFQVQTSVLSGAGGGGISANGTGIDTSSTPTNTPLSNASISAISPNQQGVVMQWWIDGVALPLTRSCLMGGAL